VTCRLAWLVARSFDSFKGHRSSSPLRGAMNEPPSVDVRRALMIVCASFFVAAISLRVEFRAPRATVQARVTQVLVLQKLIRKEMSRHHLPVPTDCPTPKVLRSTSAVRFCCCPLLSASLSCFFGSGASTCFGHKRASREPY